MGIKIIQNKADLKGKVVTVNIPDLNEQIVELPPMGKLIDDYFRDVQQNEIDYKRELMLDKVEDLVFGIMAFVGIIIFFACIVSTMMH